MTQIMYLYTFEVDSQTLRFDRMTSERPSGHPGLWTLKRREHHGIRHHATSLPTLPVTALVATLQAASALPSLSNHLNTKRKDAAAASWLWWHPVFLIVGDTHRHKSSSGRKETPRLMLSLGCIKLNSHCVRKLYKYLDWVINSCSDSWRDTVYPGEREPPSFLDRRLRRQMERRSRCLALSVWAVRARGEKWRERDGFPSFTFRIFNVRREGSESGPEPGEREGGQMLANPADVCLRLISFMWDLSL